MKKLSKRLFAVALTLALFSALTISALAASDSFFAKASGFNCSGDLYVSESSVSASLDSSRIPYEMGPIDPEASVQGVVYDANDNILGTISGSGIESVSVSVGPWPPYAAARASCSYWFNGGFLETLEVNA